MSLIDWNHLYHHIGFLDQMPGWYFTISLVRGQSWHNQLLIAPHTEDGSSEMMRSIIWYLTGTRKILMQWTADTTTQERLFQWDDEIDPLISHWSEDGFDMLKLMILPCRNAWSGETPRLEFGNLFTIPLIRKWFRCAEANDTTIQERPDPKRDQDWGLVLDLVSHWYEGDFDAPELMILSHKEAPKIPRP